MNDDWAMTYKVTRPYVRTGRSLRALAGRSASNHAGTTVWHCIGWWTQYWMSMFGVFSSETVGILLEFSCFEMMAFMAIILLDDNQLLCFFTKIFSNNSWDRIGLTNYCSNCLSYFNLSSRWFVCTVDICFNCQNWIISVCSTFKAWMQV